MRPELITQHAALSTQYSALSTQHSNRGFTLIELIVVIAIVAVIAGVFLDRVLYYQEQAEKTAMEGVAASMQSALTMQYAQIVTRGQPSDVPALAYANPMDWLQRKPPNYAGEFYDPEPAAVEPGNWVFDLKTRDLVYVPNRANYFKPGKDGWKWARFHVVLDYERPLHPSMRHEPAGLTGVVFEPVEPYAWF
jgi:general secretion pathway protein G